MRNISHNSKLKILLEGLYDKDSKTRLVCVRGLGALGKSDAVPYLLQVLQHDVAAVREAAASALGEIGDSSAIDGLTAAFRNDFDRSVRRSAGIALRHITPPETPELPIAHPDEDFIAATQRPTLVSRPSRQRNGIAFLVASVKQQIQFWFNSFLA